jgi:metal transporter CNNM
LEEESMKLLHPDNFPTAIRRSNRLLQQQRHKQKRHVLTETIEEEVAIESTNSDKCKCTENDEEPPQSLLGYVLNGLAATLCVGLAALAAGLTLGLLGLDPLMLLIKERAATSEQERSMAKSLLPIVQQHHRLLVTLLLMNACANEALPIFLEGLRLHPIMCVLISVTLVLFFGEIIPSAIFTGPNQLKIASNLVPLVQMLMFLLYPIANPIAKLLDYLLHDHDDGESDEHHSGSSFNRGELAALVRLQYEERWAAKRKRKLDRRGVLAATNTTNAATTGAVATADLLGSLDFGIEHHDSLLAARRHIEKKIKDPVATAASAAAVLQRGLSHDSSDNNIYRNDEPISADEFHFQHYHNVPSDRPTSIRHAEVVMMEGALQMQTKIAIDVFTPMRNVFCIPSNMLLTERNMVKIYASGFSRIPVYDATIGKTAILGILFTKALIVVDPQDKRSVHTMPFRCPKCVSPAMPLVDLLNLFQKGGSMGGHQALVSGKRVR